MNDQSPIKENLITVWWLTEGNDSNNTGKYWFIARLQLSQMMVIIEFNTLIKLGVNWQLIELKEQTKTEVCPKAQTTCRIAAVGLTIKKVPNHPKNFIT